MYVYIYMCVNDDRDHHHSHRQYYDRTYILESGIIFSIREDEEVISKKRSQLSDPVGAEDEAAAISLLMSNNAKEVKHPAEKNYRCCYSGNIWRWKERVEKRKRK